MRDTYFYLSDDEQGDMFEGSVENFQDCFFSKPDDMSYSDFLKQIKEFALSENVTLKIDRWF